MFRCVSYNETFGKRCLHTSKIRSCVTLVFSFSPPAIDAATPKTPCVPAAPEASPQQQQQMSVRRRAKSLGALRGPEQPSSSHHQQATSPSGAATVSLIEPDGAPLLPFLFSRMVQDRTALYSSYPSIKCDIVEYL